MMSLYFAAMFIDISIYLDKSSKFVVWCVNMITSITRIALLISFHLLMT